MTTLDPQRITQKERYKLATGAVVPRPIAWVSTMDEAGRLNLAPFSFFTVAATDPLTLLFCVQVVAAGAKKDTLRNIEARGEFVINLPDERTFEAMNLSATELPPGDSEFEWAGVAPAASERIAVPRVAEAPVAFECRLRQLVPLGEAVGAGTIVLGEVLLAHVRDDIYDERGYILLERLQPVGRLAGNHYARIHESFSRARVPPP